MAAYAALLSLGQILDQIQHHPPHLTVSLDIHKIQFLREKVSYLVDFFEHHFNGCNDATLENRVATVAYKAEDIIESNVVDQILSRSTGHNNEVITGLINVVEEMDSIIELVIMIREGRVIQSPRQPKLTRTHRAGSDETVMVGFEDEFVEIMDRLSRLQSSLHVIPVVGMAGMGKTTLARNVYETEFSIQHFDVSAWFSISQECEAKEILLGILLCQRRKGSDENSAALPNNWNHLGPEELGQELHRCLWGRRYLIILDDMWSIDAWDMVRIFLPNNDNMSRVIVTTRLSSVATYFDSSGSSLEMSFLDEDSSWRLFCKTVFSRESCPFRLKKIGKKIVKSCYGLPLSIVVVGEILAKAERTTQYWLHVANDINSIINLEDDKRCMIILSLSYHHLPIHLKPCFLYLGAFPEGCKIRVPWLIKLWIAEGFLKPVNGKDLEVVGEEYLMDLISRNLVLVDKWGSNGKIKSCKMHDLILDLCLRESSKEKFLYVPSADRGSTSEGTEMKRRISIQQSTSNEKDPPQVLRVLQSVSLARSLLCYIDGVVPLDTFRLLRILKTDDKYNHRQRRKKHKYSLGDTFQLVNSRYLSFQAQWDSSSIFPSSVHILWNLQTLIVGDTKGHMVAPPEIWEMTQLRHLEFDQLCLPDPPTGQMEVPNDFVLENLQTLLGIRNFRCSEELVKRIPNMKKLQISYDDVSQGFEEYCLDNLVSLLKLESLACVFLSEMRDCRDDLLQNLEFPLVLRKLTLQGCQLHWDDMTKIGTLPVLEVLKLKVGSFSGKEWKPFEDEFCCLKFLLIDHCNDLVKWIADSTHFPCLERLVLRSLNKLEAVPSDFAEIPTIQSIKLEYCSYSAGISAKKIREDQLDMGIEGLQVEVRFSKKTLLEHLTFDCFKFETCNIFKSNSRNLYRRML